MIRLEGLPTFFFFNLCLNSAQLSSGSLIFVVVRDKASLSVVKNGLDDPVIFLPQFLECLL